MITNNQKPWFEKCEACDCDILKVRVVPFGKFGTDHEFICTKCGKCIGGVINDPMNEWEEES